MNTHVKQEAQNPLILRCHRLMEAFAKSDDERDFYIDRLEGFLLYADLDKPQNELDALEQELRDNGDRFCPIPKLTFYETKKIMEGFVNEKVYDIDTKEKLLDIIQSKEARENFLEFIYDHHAEQEKWQQFYQERSRIRIIEWLRLNHFHFVFEEDLDLPKLLIEKLKQSLFQQKVGKDIQNARKTLVTKAKTYYSNEALNPRPKRGRPPKQAAKPDIEPQVTLDIYTTVPPSLRPFLFTPELSATSAFSVFSSKFENNEGLLGRRQHFPDTDSSLSQKLASLRALSTRWVEPEAKSTPQPTESKENFDLEENENNNEDTDALDLDDHQKGRQKKSFPKNINPPPSSKIIKLNDSKGKESPKMTKAKSTPQKPSKPTKPKAKRIIPRIGKDDPKGKILKKIVTKKPPS